MTDARRLHPSIPALTFITWWIVSAVVFAARMLNADGDMLRHIRHGTWMLEHGRLITEDPFSFTRGGDPFVAFEYGSQLFYALVHRVGGIAAVAAAAGILIAASYALLARFLLRRGADPLLTYLVTVVAAVLGAVHWVPRPHLFTLLFVTLLLHLLEPGPDGDEWPPARAGLAAALLFGVWANLHGGFVLGLILVGGYWAGSVLEWLTSPSDRPLWRRRIIGYLVIGVAGGLATLLTPHGIKLHLHVVALLQDTYLLAHTQEFVSPDFHSTVGKLFLCGLLLLMAGLAIVPARPDWRRLLVILVMSAFALNARRNIQLFGLVAYALLALHVSPWWRRLPDWRGIRAVFERDARTGRTAPYIGLVVLVALVLGLARGRVAGVQVIPDAVSPVEFPVDVVRQARADGATGRMFHDFVWGGYLLQAWPEQKVFIDGGTDFYGDELMYTYINTSELGGGWRDSLASWDISQVLMPTGAGLLLSLATQDGWAIRYCDATATLLERPAGEPAAATSVEQLRACRERPVGLP
jgi:hypothetical protein